MDTTTYTIPASEIVEGDMIDMAQYEIRNPAQGDEIVVEYELCSVESIIRGPGGECAIEFSNIYGILATTADTEIDVVRPA